jgi:hypothetical protein
MPRITVQRRAEPTVTDAPVVVRLGRVSHTTTAKLMSQASSPTSQTMWRGRKSGPNLDDAVSEVNRWPSRWPKPRNGPMR